MVGLFGEVRVVVRNDLWFSMWFAWTIIKEADNQFAIKLKCQDVVVKVSGNNTSAAPLVQRIVHLQRPCSKSQIK